MVRFVALIDGEAGAYLMFPDARRVATQPRRHCVMPSKPYGSGSRTQSRTVRNCRSRGRSKSCAPIPMLRRRSRKVRPLRLWKVELRPFRNAHTVA
jgi:hypothetical protein